MLSARVQFSPLGHAWYPEGPESEAALLARMRDVNVGLVDRTVVLIIWQLLSVQVLA